jgi:hypothetical protein
VESSQTPDVTHIDQSTVHEVLSNRRRRTLLGVLHAEGGETTVSTLVEGVAAVEARPDGDGLADRGQSGTALDTVRTSLQHCHLPVLTDADVVVHDTDAGRVSRTPAGRRLDRVRRVTTTLL